jgi:hypothetical protein
VLECGIFAILTQINPEKSREEFRTINQKNGGSGVKDFMDGMGLGILADQVHAHIFVTNTSMVHSLFSHHSLVHK